MSFIKKKEALQVDLRVWDPGEEHQGQEALREPQHAQCLHNQTACASHRGANPKGRAWETFVAEKLPFCESWELFFALFLPVHVCTAVF